MGGQNKQKSIFGLLHPPLALRIYGVLGLSGLNLQHIVVNYVMQTVLRGCNSPLEAIVFM